MIEHMWKNVQWLWRGKEEGHRLESLKEKRGQSKAKQTRTFDKVKAAMETERTSHAYTHYMWASASQQYNSLSEVLLISFAWISDQFFSFFFFFFIIILNYFSFSFLFLRNDPIFIDNICSVFLSLISSTT